MKGVFRELESNRLTVEAETMFARSACLIHAIGFGWLGGRHSLVGVNVQGANIFKTDMSVVSEVIELFRCPDIDVDADRVIESWS